MSLDRRIVSILYHNGIFDVEKIEHFIGEKDNYYEVMIDGEIKKLKIPGKEYLDQQFDKDFLEEVEKLKIKKRTQKIKIEETPFEKEMEKTEIENKKFLEAQEKEIEIKKEPKKPRTSTKKLKIVESKKIDDDIDDFINTI